MATRATFTLNTRLTHHRVEFTLVDVIEWMSKDESTVLPTSIDLRDREQIEAIFDMITSKKDFLLKEQIDRLGMMRADRFRALFELHE